MNLPLSLNKIPYFPLISRIARKNNINIWLVGGFLRDIYLKKEKDLIDFDFCVERDTTFIVKEFAGTISSKYIILDKPQESLRVIFKRKGKNFTYDFTRIRGKTFREDLSLRDFSINALGVNLNDKKIKLIDLFNTKKDLDQKVIRVIKEEVIPQDPLRILRGFAFSANYGFHIEAKTLRYMIKYKNLIKNVSKERINEEFFKILSCPNSIKIIKEMDKLKIIEEIIPYISKVRNVSQGGYHHLDVWNHSLEALRQFELFWRKTIQNNKDMKDYFDEELVQGRSRTHILKLACLLHDIGKPLAKKKHEKRTIFHTHEKIGMDLAEGIAVNLKLSLKEKELLKKLIFWHLRPGYLADQIVPTERAVYRFFRDTQKEGVAVIILSFADWRATRGPLTDAKKRKRHERIMLGLANKYFEDQKKKPFSKVVGGDDLMKKFKLKPGPLIGEVLKKINEEQALGKIKTKTKAYEVAKRIIKQNVDVKGKGKKVKKVQRVTS